MGSGNDFPKACGIPLDTSPALKCLTDGTSAKVDVGMLDERVFVNGLGIGLDGAVAHRFGKLKMFGGFAGYLLGAVIEAFSFKGFDATGSCKDRSVKGRYLLCGACNGPFQGGKFMLAPDASVKDGLLDIYFIDDIAPFKRLFKIPKVMEGRHLDFPEVNMIKTDEFLLEISRRLPAHLDGEPVMLDSGEYRIRVLKQALDVMLPDG